MNPTISESPSGFFRIYTRTLTVLNICLGIAAVLMAVAAVVFFCASYLFNDSGHVPEATAPIVRFLLIDSLIAIILLIWQIKARKALFAMLPASRKSMLALGVAYVVIAVINLFQFYLFSLPLAAIGIWWLIYFSRSSTRAAFENPQPSPETLPPPS
jgi:hypothetical protein